MARAQVAQLSASQAVKKRNADVMEVETGVPSNCVLRWSAGRGEEYVYEGGVQGLATTQVDSPDPTTHMRQHTGEPYATLTYPDGHCHEGEWRTGKRHGHGVMHTANGYRYEGAFQADTPSGKGSENFTRHEYVKCDHYSHGRPTKEGTIFYKPRDEPSYKYNGCFSKAGRRHGPGAITYSNGDIYYGTWKEGKRQGKGVTLQVVRKKYATVARKLVSVWEEDKLVSGPTELLKADPEIEAIITGALNRAPAEEDMPQGSAGYAPADLTKWKVQDGVLELSLEHFHRLNAGFELLDDDYSGELSMAELTKLWGSNDQKMLKRLDRNKDGHVSLYEVLLEWYGLSKCRA